MHARVVIIGESTFVISGLPSANWKENELGRLNVVPGEKLVDGSILEYRDSYENSMTISQVGLPYLVSKRWSVPIYLLNKWQFEDF